MGDDDHGLAVVAHVAQHGKELIRLLGGQHRRRLVQNQDVRPAVEHLYDLHRLLLADGHIVDLLSGIHVKAIGVADLPHLFGYGLQIQPPRLVQAENDVFRRAEHVHKLEVLVDHADAQVKGVPGGADHDLFAVHGNGALIREIDAGEHVHQRGLAAAVFAQ